MVVTVEPLAIGSLEGPRVWIVARRVGAHLDIEECPDYVDSTLHATGWAAGRWGVPEFEVKLLPVQVIELWSGNPEPT